MKPAAPVTRHFDIASSLSPGCRASSVHRDRVPGAEREPPLHHLDAKTFYTLTEPLPQFELRAALFSPSSRRSRNCSADTSREPGIGFEAMTCRLQISC